MFRRTGVAVAASFFLYGSSEAANRLDELIKRKFERVQLAHLPTPLEEMKNLSEALGGPRLYVKRDDETGLAFGGNKARKLDFIFADVLAKKSDVVLTWAGVQSNWARQTAAACTKFGIRPILLLSKNDVSPTENGNLLIDALLGADVRILEPGEDRGPLVDRILAEEKEKGNVVYTVPVGGSSPAYSMEEPLGAIAYAYAFQEMHQQAAEQGFAITHVVVATGSGGTQAGLMVGAKAVDPSVEIVGIAVSTEKGAVKKFVAEIANQTAKSLGLDLTFTPEETVVIDDYLGEGYGHLSEPIVEALTLVSRHEGILIDPVYTGKAMAGLVDKIRKGHFEKNDGVVFLHTGGTPALFAYEGQLLEHLDQKNEALAPVPLELECGPVVGLLEAFRLRERELGLSKSSRGGGAREIASIEVLHQLGGGLIVHLPGAGDDRRRSGVHEAANEAQESLAPHFFPQTGLAGAQNDEVDGQAQVVDVVETKESVLRVLVLVDEGENDSGKLGMRVVGDGMGGEVDGAIALEVGCTDPRSVGAESGHHVDGAVRRQCLDGERLGAASRKRGGFSVIRGIGGDGSPPRETPPLALGAETLENRRRRKANDFMRLKESEPLPIEERGERNAAKGSVGHDHDPLRIREVRDGIDENA
jgi:D-cysteine desulfhydrase family pyridoxal phosphate-dependent enzyme